MVALGGDWAERIVQRGFAVWPSGNHFMATNRVLHGERIVHFGRFGVGDSAQEKEMAIPLCRAGATDPNRRCLVPPFDVAADPGDARERLGRTLCPNCTRMLPPQIWVRCREAGFQMAA